MIKYFCDKCETEVPSHEAVSSLDMTGKVLCREHRQEYEEMMQEHKKYCGVEANDFRVSIRVNKYFVDVPHPILGEITIVETGNLPENKKEI
jgi:hypothetical protein